MLHESLKISTSDSVQASLTAEGHVFRYCEIENAVLEGGCFDGVFIDCGFKKVEWYWGLFNLAVLVNCKFEDCTFLGTSFAGCQFVECTFTNCRFAADNLGGSCSNSGSRFFACSVSNCDGWDELLRSNDFVH